MSDYYNQDEWDEDDSAYRFAEFDDVNIEDMHHIESMYSLHDDEEEEYQTRRLHPRSLYEIYANMTEHDFARVYMRGEMPWEVTMVEELQRDGIDVEENGQQLYFTQMLRIIQEKQYEWTPEIERRARENVKCNNEWRQILQQIKRLSKKLKSITEKRRQRIEKALLRFNPTSEWQRLSPKQRWKKENVLLCMTSPYCFILPDELNELNWSCKPNAHSVPLKLREDLDLLFARISRPEFARFYRQANSGNDDSNCRDDERVTLQLSESALSNKSIVIKLLEVYPEGLYDKKIADSLLKDREVFYTVLKIPAVDSNKKHLKFLRQFKINTKEDIDFLLDHGAKTKSYHLLVDMTPRGMSTFGYLAVSLAQSCPFIPNDALKRFSVRLRDRIYVVEAFIKRNGNNIEYATARIRNNKRMICLACETHPLAVCHATPALKSELTKDKNFMLSLLQNPKNTESVQQKLLDLCPPDFLRDYNVALCAMSINQIVKDLTFGRSKLLLKKYRFNRQFWNDAVSRYPIMWDNIPYKHQDAEMAMAILRRVNSFTCVHQFEFFLRLFPSTLFLHDREIMLSIIRCLDPGNILKYWITSPFVNDREIVLLLAKKCDQLFLALFSMESNPFTADNEVLEECIKSFPTSVIDVPEETLLERPELLILAIEHADESDLYLMYEMLGGRLWANLDVAKAWIATGTEYHDEFPEEFSENKELFLLVAEHLPGYFANASETLLEDKEFMLQVVTKNGMLLSEASPELQKDFDVMLAAFANDIDLCRQYVSADLDGIDTDLLEFGEQVRNRLLFHESFVTFSRGCYCSTKAPIALCPSQLVHTSRSVRNRNGRSRKQQNNAVAGAPVDRCPLKMLNQGGETMRVYMTKIAEYIGVPLNEELRLLRQASANLEQWGI